nr:MAG TPA_asm: hypothetical protein [Caudoviricetes sp.]DAR16581.1 MAG TPA: hypothetical protein [Caudoviricetes sp.]DAV44009.1 MAG TPA: hypothetical protein [Caudoviricetes sp.]
MKIIFQDGLRLSQKRYLLLQLKKCYLYFKIKKIYLCLSTTL